MGVRWLGLLLGIMVVGGCGSAGQPVIAGGAPGTPMPASVTVGDLGDDPDVPTEGVSDGVSYMT